MRRKENLVHISTLKRPSVIFSNTVLKDKARTWDRAQTSLEIFGRMGDLSRESLSSSAIHTASRSNSCQASLPPEGRGCRLPNGCFLRAQHDAWAPGKYAIRLCQVNWYVGYPATPWAKKIASAELYSQGTKRLGTLVKFIFR